MARQAKSGRNDKVNYTGGNMVLVLWLAAVGAGLVGARPVGTRVRRPFDKPVRVDFGVWKSDFVKNDPNGLTDDGDAGFGFAALAGFVDALAFNFIVEEVCGDRPRETVVKRPFWH